MDSWLRPPKNFARGICLVGILGQQGQSFRELLCPGWGTPGACYPLQRGYGYLKRAKGAGLYPVHALSGKHSNGCREPTGRMAESKDGRRNLRVRAFLLLAAPWGSGTSENFRGSFWVPFLPLPPVPKSPAKTSYGTHAANGIPASFCYLNLCTIFPRYPIPLGREKPCRD